MRFQLNGPIGEGRIVEFDQDTMLVKEARLLKKVTGLGLRQFGEGMRNGDIDALMGMVYLALRRAGVAIAWRALDEFNINDLEALADDEDEARALEAAKRQVVDGAVVEPDEPPEYGDDDPSARRPVAAVGGPAEVDDDDGAAVTELRPTAPPAPAAPAPRRRRSASR